VTAACEVPGAAGRTNTQRAPKSPLTERSAPVAEGAGDPRGGGWDVDILSTARPLFRGERARIRESLARYLAC